ncbi:MAG TPA: GH116 family glycosyl-hydrolase [Verrucomicrobiae bacterium]
MKSVNLKPCARSSCACHAPDAARWSRRDFLRSIGVGAGAMALQPWHAMAGPFTPADFDKLVPADKKLRPEWVKSLTERGQRTVYRGADLEKIGMPIGGLFAGQVYLGGDGRLWHWDIFNQRIATGAGHYAEPMKPASPFEQGFAIRIHRKDGRAEDRVLDRAHWRDVSFTGEYPIGYMEYRDPNCPVSVNLEAFSPFVPLDVEDSSLPVTVMEFTLTNHSQSSVELTLAGWLENAVCLHSSKLRQGFFRNRLVRREGLLALDCSAEAPPPGPTTNRPDILFDDFEHETYGNWKATGTAFGAGPVEIAKIPAYQGDVGGRGKRVVNSHASAPGNSVEQRDAAKGTLTSAPFKIERDYITFLIGGGAHKSHTCMNLLVGEEAVLSATGRDNNHMQPASWDVRRWAGRAARLQIIDDESGGWGNIGIDQIVFTDQPGNPAGPLASEPDFGTMALALLGPRSGDFGCTDVAGNPATGACDPIGTTEPARKPFGQKLTGSVARKLKLHARGSTRVTFLVSWHMPNLKLDRLPPGRHYASRFDSALSVARYLQRNLKTLCGQTRLWHETWYDSSLPYWFLDRTFLNTSILATSTCYRFGDGRFYGWEGVGCCEGTCGHVWQYAHAMARLFPEMERITREKVDFGLALQPDGAIHFRGEFNDIPAIDAQAGTILRALREHQMSPDDAFLRRNWPKIRKATEWLIAKDANGDGLIESNQHNTLDTDWFGPVAWLSGLYLAALLASETMARLTDDQDFAHLCRSIFDAGQKNIVAQLFSDGYFINKPDPAHLDAINSGTGCEIDQVFGQSWAFQVGLPRVLPEEETISSLRSLWRYNFTPDVGLYRQVYKPGRWYAMPGEAGLLMCTFPRSDWDYAQAKGKGPEWAAGYFNECMNGFEYEVAGHMIREGLLTEGLAITRAVHDRYHASRRNPWNEIECGDHYARSMASYGIFLAACGFEYDGPKGHIGFSPRLKPENFKAAFTSAEGWGSYQQKVETSTTRKRAKTLDCELMVKYGKLRLRTFAVALPDSFQPSTVRVSIGNVYTGARFLAASNRLEVSLREDVVLGTGTRIQIRAA